MLTAMHSGAGKTVLACALMAAYKKRGLDVCACKCGPDYIDPMFHRRVLGIPSRNLDLFLQGEAGVKRSLARAKGDLTILEAAMGYYDGLAGTDHASAYDLARRTDTSALLVLRPRGSGLSLAAQVRGMMTFREDSHLVGLLLTDCKPSLAAYLRPILERECGLPVLGALPPMEEARLDSRHLGLLTANEVENFSERFAAIAEQVEKSADLDAILNLAVENAEESKEVLRPSPRCTIAVARDEAFCFCYEDSLEALRSAGAELRFFSPLRDAAFPEDAEGLYLCGGYPELYARQLSENTAMRRSIGAAVAAGLPTVAECGGFLYLQETLEDEAGCAFPQCGVLPGRGYRTDSLQRFGYLWLEAPKDSLLFRSGERVPAHEFHYWDSTDNGEDIGCVKPGGRTWRGGWAGETLYAGFPHLHLDGELPLAARF
ncbi:MAG: cobyrinate a,c-diamide synthase, partial [Oscillospiraceae bacterium]|nr:cobyrinate a,c-diamide synthase [Oscillospiraceae bacterium]